MPARSAARFEAHAPQVQIEIIMDEDQIAEIGVIESDFRKQVGHRLSALVHEGLRFRYDEFLSGKRSPRAEREPVSAET